MLLHYQGMSINVERQLLAVNGDKDGARNIVRDLVSNLLTECVHVVISEVVMSMIHTRDDQTTSGHFTLNLNRTMIIFVLIISCSLPGPVPPPPWGQGLC